MLAKSALAIIAALLPAAVAPAGEEYLPLHPGEANPGWRRTTSLDYGKINAGETPRQNLVRLKLPASAPPREQRSRLINVAANPDGSLDFNPLRLESPIGDPSINSVIPGLITPEELALDQYNLNPPGETGTFPKNAIDPWTTPFPENIRLDFPDWGQPAWPSFPALDSPEPAGRPSVVPAGQPTEKETPADGKSLRPPPQTQPGTLRLRPPADSAISNQPSESILDAAPDMDSNQSGGEASSLPAISRESRPADPPLPLARSPGSNPAWFENYLEPIRWPEPLDIPAQPPASSSDNDPPAGSIDLDETNRIHSRRTKSIGITPLRELKNILRPVHRVAQP
ncbi:MAG: hypothetical protein LBU64_04785 [Planctomycetota bacterium]|nr:hypothetical protein [Planctomycetota bacterium]